MAIRIFGAATNLLALAAERHGVLLMADSLMSTHCHFLCMCDDPGRFCACVSKSITRWFNFHHSRKGPLFDGKFFFQNVKGPRHIQMTMNYVLRQGLHHGISDSAFDYPWSTCNYLFPRERGVSHAGRLISTEHEMRQYLPKNAHIPDGWHMDGNGCEPVTLSMIEAGCSKDDIARMLQNENSQKYVNRNVPDMDICSVIDNDILGGARSVYTLPAESKRRIYNELRNDAGYMSESQLRRCLAMDYLF